MAMKNDMVNHPSHYNQGGIECIDAMIAAYGRPAVRTFCELNAFKYIYRCQHKNNRVEDIKKAIWYLEKSIEIHNADMRVNGVIKEEEVWDDGPQGSN